MEKQIFTASCPICGRTLFKGSPESYIEGGCPKCNSYLYIQYTTAGVQSKVAEKTDKIKNYVMPKR